MTIAKYSLKPLAPVLQPRYRCGLTHTGPTQDAVMNLRSLVFRGGLKGDADKFDARARHIAVQAKDGGVVGACRLFELGADTQVNDCYSAQFYDLSPLAGNSFPMVELGRVCIHPDHRDDAEILRLLWGAVASAVDMLDATMIFGCSSFSGDDIGPHAATLGWLGRRFPAPRAFGSIPGRNRTVALAGLTDRSEDPRAGIPSLLRGYLSMGGWVGDNAVIDPDLGTVHVFTGLEVAKISPARKRSLRALADICAL